MIFQIQNNKGIVAEFQRIKTEKTYSAIDAEMKNMIDKQIDIINSMCEKKVTHEVEKTIKKAPKDVNEEIKNATKLLKNLGLSSTLETTNQSEATSSVANLVQNCGEKFLNIGLEKDCYQKFLCCLLMYGAKNGAGNEKTIFLGVFKVA